MRPSQLQLAEHFARPLAGAHRTVDVRNLACHRQHQGQRDGHDDEPEAAQHLEHDDGRGKDQEQSP